MENEKFWHTFDKFSRITHLLESKKRNFDQSFSFQNNPVMGFAKFGHIPHI